MQAQVLAAPHVPAPRASVSSFVQARTLRLAMPDSSPTLDPAVVANDDSVELANLLYVGLVRMDASYHVIPAAASRIVLSRDHRVYTFYIKRDLHFSNGDPVQAQDFAYSINRSLNPALKSPSAATYLLDIKGAPAVFAGKSRSASGIRVIDDHTLQIVARWPVPYFLMELTYPTSFALDRKAISRLGPVDSTAWYSNPVCSGPFRVKSWSPGNRIVLVANKQYRTPPPRLQQIVISLAPFPPSGLYSYLARSLDVATLPTSGLALAQKPGIVRTDILGGNSIYMNMASRPFDSKQVRQALTLSLNRYDIVQQTMGPSVTPSNRVAPSFGADAQIHVPAFDDRRAQTLFKSSKYGRSGHTQLTLYYVDDPHIARLAKAIARAWHKYLGVSVSTQGLTLSTLLTRVEANSLSLYLSGWSADYPDPHDWLSLLWESDALNNNVRYRDAAFDRVVETADVTWNPAQRARLYAEAQQILINDATTIPLYVPRHAVFIRPSVSNLVLTGYGLVPRSGTWADVSISPTSARSRRAH